MNRFNLFICITVVTLLAACQTSQKKITIGYVQIIQSQVLDAAKAGVFRALADSGFIDGQNIRVIDNNAQGDLSMISMILQSLIAQNVDIIITNGTPCMVAAAQTVKNIPVVFTVSFGPEQVGLKTTPDNLHGAYSTLNAVAFTDLMAECIPNLKRIGIPYNNAESNAEYSVNVLGTEFTRRGITLVKASVTSSNDILQAGQYLAGQQVDAFVVAADNTIYLGLPILSKIASEQNIPLFVTDPLYTEKGAAVGLGANFAVWGYQSGLKAVEILKGRGSSMNRIEPIIRYDLYINSKTSGEQGLMVPQSVIGRATRVIH